MTTALLLVLLSAGVTLAQEAPTTQLRISMIAIGVKDPARSVKFYVDTLGLQLIGKPGEVTLVKAGDVTLVLNQPLWNSSSRAGAAIAGAVEIIFPVSSVVTSHQDLAARGCDFIASPHEITPGMWAATFTDPDGHKLTILGAK